MSDHLELRPMNELRPPKLTTPPMSKKRVNSANRSRAPTFEPIPEEDEDQEVLLCGYGSCTPTWLQRFHTSKWLLMTMTVVAMSLSFFGSTIMTSTTTIERRFGLSSTHIGLFTSIRKGMVVIFVIPVAHMVNRGHKGRWIAWGSMLIAVGALVSSSAEFVQPYGGDHVKTATPVVPGAVWANDTKHYANGSLISSDICSLEKEDNHDNFGGQRQSASMHDLLMSVSLPYVVLLCGQVLQGLGGIPIAAVGKLYIDDNVTQHGSPMYLSIYRAIGILGAVFGFILSSVFLGIPHNVLMPDASNDWSSPEDPRFVGAWWLGFIVGSLPILLAAIPLLAFAHTLPATAKLRKKDTLMTHATVGEVKKGQKFIDIPKQLWILTKIPYFCLMIIFDTLDQMIFGGFGSFYPKIMEQFFNLSPRQSSILTGILFIPMVMLTILLSGYVVRKFRFNVRQNFIFMLVTSAIGVVGAGLWFLQCEAPNYVGFMTPYDPSVNGHPQKQLTSPCNEGCGCDNTFIPVCNAELNIAYYSPCYAGCRNGLNDSFSNCSCLAQKYNGSLAHATLVPGSCAKPFCNNFYIFFIIFMPLMIIRGSDSAAKLQVHLRIIPTELRALSAATRRTVRSIAVIPSALIVGAVIDSACMMWNEKSGQEYCVRYDNWRMGKIMAIISVTQTVAWCFFYALNMWLYKVPTEVSKPEEYDEEFNRKTSPAERKMTHDSIVMSQAVKDIL